MTPGDRRWLAGEALRWLSAGRLRTRPDVAVARRLIDAIPSSARVGGLTAALQSPAALATSHGDLGLAIDLLDLAVDTARGPEQVAVLSQRGDCHRDRGRWDLALADYLVAVELASSDGDTDPRTVADLAIRAARLTWDPDIGQRVDGILTATIEALPPGERVWRARLRLCLAGGSFQDGVAAGGRLRPGDVEEALAVASSAFDPTAPGLGADPRPQGPARHRPGRAVEPLGRRDRRRGRARRRPAGPRPPGPVRGRPPAWRLGGGGAGPPPDRPAGPGPRCPVEQRFSAVVARTCWDLANGRLPEAERGLARELAFRDELGGSTFDQITLAHTIWLARARGDEAELSALADAAAAFADAHPGGEIWTAGAALLAADVGRHTVAAERAVGFARRAGGFDRLRPGAHRLGLLGIAALVAAGAAAHCSSSPFTDHDLRAIAEALSGTDCRVVLIGWPTVVLGPVDRFRALALVALGDHRAAVDALRAAAEVEAGARGLAAEASRAATLVDAIGRSAA